MGCRASSPPPSPALHITPLRAASCLRACSRAHPGRHGASRGGSAAGHPAAAGTADPLSGALAAIAVVGGGAPALPRCGCRAGTRSGVLPPLVCLCRACAAATAAALALVLSQLLTLLLLPFLVLRAGRAGSGVDCTAVRSEQAVVPHLARPSKRLCPPSSVPARLQAGRQAGRRSPWPHPPPPHPPPPPRRNSTRQRRHGSRPATATARAGGAWASANSAT